MWRLTHFVTHFFKSPWARLFNVSDFGPLMSKPLTELSNIKPGYCFETVTLQEDFP